MGAPFARFRLLTRLREHARVPASQSRAVLISIRRLLILCLISTTLVRIGTKRFPVWLILCHMRFVLMLETVRILCVPVGKCSDVEDELGAGIGACW